MSNVFRRLTVLIIASCMCSTMLAGEFVPVDLVPHANQQRSEQLGRTSLSHLKELPGGKQIVGDVPFRIGDGLLMLGSQLKTDKPQVIRHISINRQVTRLHILHGCTCAAYEGAKSVPDATEIGEYFFYYEDRSTARLPMIYGGNVRDWWGGKVKTVPDAKVGWETSPPNKPDTNDTFKRLYLVTWENPEPEKTIVSVDFVSRKNTVSAAPFCVAMTVESPDVLPGSPPASPLPASTPPTVAPGSPAPAASNPAVVSPVVAKSSVSPEAATRLADLEKTFDLLFQQRDSIVPQRLPHITTIDAAASEIVALNRENVSLNKQHANLTSQARSLKNSRDRTKDANEQVILNRQVQDIQRSAANVSAQHAGNITEIGRCATARDAAARELERLNGELLRCWNELETARGLRLDLFGASEKYLRGEDSVVRAQLEHWLLKDTYWQDGYFWAGLAAFEMGDIDAAADLVEHGKRAVSETAVSFGRRASAGRLHALSGLVATRMKTRKHPGPEDLKAAVRVALQSKDKADWVVFVLAGRVAMERDQKFAQAQTYLTRAEELKASPLVRLWRARLQTVAPADSAERDLDAGVQELEKLWADSSEKSWRVGLFLIDAHLAHGNREAATAVWSQARVTIPKGQMASISQTVEQQIGEVTAK